jgi:hypothetical protein
VQVEPFEELDDETRERLSRQFGTAVGKYNQMYADQDLWRQKRRKALVNQPILVEGDGDEEDEVSTRHLFLTRDISEEEEEEEEYRAVSPGADIPIEALSGPVRTRFRADPHIRMSKLENLPTKTLKLFVQGVQTTELVLQGEYEKRTEAQQQQKPQKPLFRKYTKSSRPRSPKRLMLPGGN